MNMVMMCYYYNWPGRAIPSSYDCVCVYIFVCVYDRTRKIISINYLKEKNIDVNL